MSMTTNLLRKAYACIDAGNFQDARAILNSLVHHDPTNIEVWEISMQICETCEGLDVLCDQALQNIGLDPSDRKSLLDYYYFLRHKLKNQVTGIEPQKMVTFELVNEFTYTLEKPTRMKSANTAGASRRGFNIANFLGPAITIMYLILFVIGLVLISFGNNFGYWIILIQFLSIAAALLNTILTKQTQYMHTSDTIELFEESNPKPTNIP
jgi:hypothetical protein